MRANVFINDINIKNDTETHALVFYGFVIARSNHVYAVLVISYAYVAS